MSTVLNRHIMELYGGHFGLDESWDILPIIKRDGCLGLGSALVIDLKNPLHLGAIKKVIFGLQ